MAALKVLHFNREKTSCLRKKEVTGRRSFFLNLLLFWRSSDVWCLLSFFQFISKWSVGFHWVDLEPWGCADVLCLTAPSLEPGTVNPGVRCFNWRGFFGPVASNEIDRTNLLQNEGRMYCECPQTIFFFCSLNKNENELGRIRPEYDTTFIFFSGCGPELFVRKLQVIETSAWPVSFRNLVVWMFHKRNTALSVDASLQTIHWKSVGHRWFQFLEAYTDGIDIPFKCGPCTRLWTVWIYFITESEKMPPKILMNVILWPDANTRAWPTLVWWRHTC